MTDTLDTASSPDSPTCDWDAKRAVFERLRAELQPRNKAALFDLLAAADITHVVVSFDGYGDSGQIEHMEAKRGDVTVAIPDAQIEIARAVWDQDEPERQRVAGTDVLEQFVYDLLEDTHYGWEDGDGACGDFTFDVAARKITLDYNERYTETQNFRHVF
jgi:hypothetical protein